MPNKFNNWLIEVRRGLMKLLSSLISLWMCTCVLMSESWWCVNFWVVWHCGVGCGPSWCPIWCTWGFVWFTPWILASTVVDEGITVSGIFVGACDTTFFYEFTCMFLHCVMSLGHFWLYHWTLVWWNFIPLPLCWIVVG